MSDLSLKVERVIDATPEAIFDAWLSPKMLQRFMMPAADMSVPSATSDAKVGGRFEIVMRAGEQDMPHRGTYLDITPHERIVFTWESPFSPEESEVTVTLKPVDAGTLVTLSHVRFLDEQKRDNHEGGWTKILDVLATEMSVVSAAG